MDFWRATTLEEQIDTAMGRQEADLVLKGGNVFNVFLLLLAIIFSPYG